MYYQYLFLTFALLTYIIAVDENVAKYFCLQLKNLQLNFIKLYLMITIHPKSPIANWIWNRKMKNIIRSFEEENNNV